MTWLSALASLLRPAEDPRVRYAPPDAKQRQALETVRTLLVDVRATRTRLAEQACAVQGKLDLLRPADADDDQLARLRARRAEIARAELEEIELHGRALEREERRLAAIEEWSLIDLERLSAREDTLDAGLAAAEAQVRVRELLADAPDPAELAAALGDTEERLERLRARATAIDDLMRAGVLDVPEGV